MCGLFGAASNTPIKRLDQVITQLAIYNEDRGKQSWGVFDGKKLAKGVGPISRNLWRIPRADRGLLLGHTRAATVGDVTQANAHPFEFTSADNKCTVVGAHNGHVANHEELNKKYNTELQVDSMHIFWHIANGVPMGDIEGYGAITFVKDGVLYLGRFNGGQLAVAQIEKAGLIWSSDESALSKALEGANLKHFTYEIEEGATYYFTQDKLWDAQNKITISTYAKRNFNNSNFNRGVWPSNNNRCNSTRESNQRFVRIRVVKSEPPAEQATAQEPPILPKELVEEMQPKIQTPTLLVNEATSSEERQSIVDRNKIMCDIHNDENITLKSSSYSACHRCGATTNRRLLGDKFTCLPCTALMIQLGEIIVKTNEQPVEA